MFLCITCLAPCLANLTYFHVHLPTRFFTWASLRTVDDINISRSTSSYPHLHTSSYPCCLLSDPRYLPVISSCQICSRRAPWLTDIYLFVFFIDGWILLLTRPRKCRNLTSRYNLVRPKVAQPLQSRRCQGATWTLLLPMGLGCISFFKLRPQLTSDGSITLLSTGRVTTEVFLCPI